MWQQSVYSKIASRERPRGFGDDVLAELFLFSFDSNPILFYSCLLTVSNHIPYSYIAIYIVQVLQN